VSGCYVGTVYVAYGTAKGLRKPEPLLDREGGLMHLGRLWSFEEDAHVSRDGPGERAYSAAPVDWDGDGDFDLLVGGDGGGFYLRTNEGTKSRPLYSTKVVAIRAGGEPARVPRYAMPILADWDGDGLADLVSGSSEGAVWWFRNVGAAGRPEFEAGRQLLPDVETGKGHEVRGPRSQVDVADFDGDGDMDLLVGDLHMNYVEERKAFDNHGWIWLFRRTGDPAVVDQGTPTRRP